MRTRWFLAASAISVLAAPAGWAEQISGPAARSFFLLGPPAAVPGPLQAASQPAGPELCRQAGRLAGRSAGIPDHLMAAIARVETGRADALGNISPWPWSINVEGVDHVYDGKPQAIAAVRAFQAAGTRSIDVGCMQVNLAYHPNAFASLDQAFDPLANATYAARFLAELRDQTGSWDRAVAAYHSANPDLGEPYRRKVVAALPEEQRIAAGAEFLPGAAMPGGGGGEMLSNNAARARILPLAASAPPGRDLTAYRAVPVQITGRRLPGPMPQLSGVRGAG